MKKHLILFILAIALVCLGKEQITLATQEISQEEQKEILSVSFNSVPKTRWYDFENVASIPAEIDLDDMIGNVIYSDGDSMEVELYEEWSALYNEESEVIGSQFSIGTKEYKVYWETLKKLDDGLYYMDELSNNNALCIEEVGGEIFRCPIEILDNPIKSVKMKSFPKDESGKMFVTYTQCRVLEDIVSEGVILTVEEKDGEIYDIHMSFMGNENEKYGFDVNVDFLDSYITESGEEYCEWGANTICFSYAGHEVYEELFFYGMEDFQILKQKECPQYPFSQMFFIDTDVRITYTDGSTKDVRLKPGYGMCELGGVTFNVVRIDNVAYLSQFGNNSKEIGPIVTKTMSDWEGKYLIAPGIPVDVSVSSEEPYVVMSYTPELAGRYAFYTVRDKSADGDYETRGMICDNTTLLTEYESQTGEGDLYLEYELQEGRTYYFIAYKVPMSTEGVFSCHLDAVSVNKKVQMISAPASIDKKMNDKPFMLDVDVLGDATLSYASSNTSVASVDSIGKVTIKAAGTTVITVKAEETNSYKAATKQITLKVAKIPVMIETKTVLKKTYGSSAFKLNVKTNGKIKFSSNNTKVAKISRSGKVTIQNCGKAIITIKASAVGYKDATKQVVINVVPKKATIKSVKSKKAGQITVKWKKQKEAKGYIIEYSTDKSFKKNIKTVKITKNSTTSKTISKLKKGKTYYVRVKAYTLINKKAEPGSVSAKKKVKTKK